MGHNSWVHCDEARVSFGNDPFIECIVQLKWVQDNGTLTVSNLDGTITRIIFLTSGDVNCLKICDEGNYSHLLVCVDTNKRPYIRFQFDSDDLLERWQAQFARISGKMDQVVAKSNEENIKQISQQTWDYDHPKRPFKVKLPTNFIPGTKFIFTGCAADDAIRMDFDFYEEHSEDIIFHFNPRFHEDRVVRNGRIKGSWGEEEVGGRMPFKNGKPFKVSIEATEDAFVAYVDDKLFTTFHHRAPPHSIGYFGLEGKVQPYQLIISRSPGHIANTTEIERN